MPEAHDHVAISRLRGSIKREPGCVGACALPKEDSPRWSVRPHERTGAGHCSVNFPVALRCGDVLLSVGTNGSWKGGAGALTLSIAPLRGITPGNSYAPIDCLGPGRRDDCLSARTQRCQGLSQ